MNKISARFGKNELDRGHKYIILQLLFLLLQVDKIGRGNFGDVYRANLHMRGRGSKNTSEQCSFAHTKRHRKNIISVAAKTCKVRK